MSSTFAHTLRLTLIAAAVCLTDSWAAISAAPEGTASPAAAAKATGRTVDTGQPSADRMSPDRDDAATTVADFQLPTIDDEIVSLSRDPSVVANVLCFLGTECPLARVYGPRLQRMSDRFADRGVRFIGINSNVQDSMDELQQYAQGHGIEFPVAKDFDRQVAVDVGATRTPEVFVIDRAGKIRYQGRIDDQYEPGLARQAATRHDLNDAIEQLIEGKEVSGARTTAVGCLIALPRTRVVESKVTFCDQVIRLLNQHCIECHRDGEIGPFALDDYDEVVGWADMSMEVIDQGRMPPWHASPHHGDFANARHMTPAEKQTLREWIDAGMPYGDASRLPARPDYASGWRFDHAPDSVVEMDAQPYQVPAEGTVEYQYFVVDPGFTEDKWIRGAQVMPGNSSVVHHCIVFTRPPDGSDFRDIGFLTAYVPGQVRGDLPRGYAQHVKAGSRLVFQMHYTPTGKPEQDLTRLGLVFADADEVTHEVFVVGGIEQEFEIPPGVADHRVDGTIRGFPRDGELLAITPHMHLRGKSFKFSVESGGNVETLLDVPLYDFNWQHNYELTDPLPLGGVDSLTFETVFDNSSDNPTNPDPSEFVTWGDQTWQEMAVTFISVAKPRHVDDSPKQSPADAAAEQKTLARRKAARKRDAKRFADRYLERFDANGDAHLTRHELPDAVRLFSFNNFDRDRDGRLTHEEIESQAYRRLERR